MFEDLKKDLQIIQKEPGASEIVPWEGDAFGRKQLADKLTGIIKGQTHPLTVGLHGEWGAGKTFFLRHWQKQLEQEGKKILYYNAWQDDHMHDDPLISIIGQLSDYLGAADEQGMKKIKGFAKDLAVNSLARVLSQATGLNIDLKKFLDEHADNLLNQYSEKNETRKKLQCCLGEIAAKVKEDTGFPLIFIIDELDRCRPTFAIELLERVKHIFGIDSIVFVFGVNREALCETIQSTYGYTNPDSYLQRFFGMELNLPRPSAMNEYCDQLIEDRNLREFFLNFSKHIKHHRHVESLEMFEGFFKSLCRAMNLSPREIERCMNSMVLVGRNMQEGQYMFPYIIALLIMLRLKNNFLYKEFIQGDCLASDVMNYIHEKFSDENFLASTDSSLSTYDSSFTFGFYIIRLEAYLYQISIDGEYVNAIFEQLKLLKEKGADALERGEYLSDKIKTDPTHAEKVISQVNIIRKGLIDDLAIIPHEHLSIKHIASLIGFT